MTASWRILHGDCREVLGSLDVGSVQCCLTSPPYLGLRDYGLPATAWPAVTYRTLGGEVRVPAMECVLGLEPSVEAWVGHLVQVFREIRRALRDDGTLWLNLGDAWNTRQRGSDNGWDKSHLSNPGRLQKAQRQALKPRPAFGDSKPKDLLGLPWQVAFALRADGWWLREEVIWSKRAPMPESVRDRCTRSHEQLFRLTKSRRYFADMEAIAEPAVRVGPIPRTAGWAEGDVPHDARSHNGRGGSRPAAAIVTTRNKRSVWTLASAPFLAAHFATFPAKLAEPAILCATSPTACGECGAPWRRVVERDRRRLSAGPVVNGWAGDDGVKRSTSGDGHRNAYHTAVTTVGFEPTCDHHDDTGRCTVLDPFAGAATTGLVALRHDRSFVGIELSAEYVELGRARILADQPLLNQAAEAS